MVDQDAVSETRALVGELPAHEAKWMDDACIMRHLNARKHDCQKAASQLQETVEFRRQLQVPQLHRDMFSEDLSRGLLYIAGHLSTGEPVMVIRKRTSKLPPEETEQYIRFLTWTFEQTIKAAGRYGKDRWVALMDLRGYSPKTSPPLSVTLRVAHILNHHYPERLHSLVLVDTPAVFHLLATAVKPFMDSVTMAKVHFASSKKRDVSTGALLSGKHDPSGLAELWDMYNTPYDQDRYLQLLKELDDEGSTRSPRITSISGALCASGGIDAALQQSSSMPRNGSLYEPFVVRGASAHAEAYVSAFAAASHAGGGSASGGSARVVAAASTSCSIRSASGHSGPILRGLSSQSSRGAVPRRSSTDARHWPLVGSRSGGAMSADLFVTADSTDIPSAHVACAISAAGEASAPRADSLA